MEQQDKAEDRGENKLFRQQSMDRVFSPDQLNDYIRVYNPSVWVVIIAVAILLAAVLIWSVFGQLPTTVIRTGISKDGVLVVYTPDYAAVSSGNAVNIGQYDGTVKEVSSEPLSYEEVAKLYTSDYTIHQMDIGDWNYRVAISAPGLPDGAWEATIITGKIHPITFIFN
jgi:hypothetical protein